MTSVQFEGNVADISLRQLELIASVLEKRGYSDVTATVEGVGKAGDNYIANVKRVKVEKDGDTFNMIAKVAPTVEALRETMNIQEAFRNENVMYTEILPRLTELERNANVPESEWLRYPICYGSFIETSNEVILLEDLQDSGFKMLDRLKPLTDHEIRLILKSFAKLHASSYALKHQHPTEFTAFRNKLTNIINMDRDKTRLEKIRYYFEALESDLHSILINEKYRRATKDVVSQMMENMQELKEDEDSEYATITHGDAWTNNIMFRFKDGEAIETCMLDYQISKIHVPPSDLHYMIFNCTDYETRDKHFDQWIDFYHSQLDHRLGKFSLKVELVYPREILDADMKRHAKASLGPAVMLASLLVRESADAEKVKDNIKKGLTDFEKAIESNKLSKLDEKTIAKFRSRVEGVIDSFIDFGYISV